ncbi:Aste57867_20784 [Aphanomyces stellatus]|uniref:Aste57867_20784 protein n=1 Tax=Aphanomyces stellatus TaxID=120398 RepID=A0A485LGH6_9STRA|nr:hypothetical protein As57867_020716 [Aphanomyces stellatus]VFT97463.1 Aste57867_20784 [Aphanomyces stellatus]
MAKTILDEQQPTAPTVQTTSSGLPPRPRCESPRKRRIPSKRVIDLGHGSVALKALALTEIEPFQMSTRHRVTLNATASDMTAHSVDVPTTHPTWLDASLPYVPIYLELDEGFSATPTATYYTITESAHVAMEHATQEIHDMFFKATEYVLDHEDEFARFFHIPASLWPKIRRSWAQSKTDIVSGRFDFALTDQGLKVYEYNADSASCLLECGYTQDAWCDAAGLGDVGRSGSESLFDDLVRTWKALAIDGPLHIMVDKDIEERYHGTYMQAAAEAAGVPCVFVVGVDSISWSEDGSHLHDATGTRIANVWKTWSWRTVMNQLEVREAATHPHDARKPQLMDVLLHDTVRVFEPLWTLLTGSKAILPILTKLFPCNPYLLKSSFHEEDVVGCPCGYAAKPVMGRTGSNISLFGADRKLIEETGGRWAHDTIVYQELAMLPQYNGMYVQVNTWAIHGAFGGVVLRQDKCSIIGLNSNIPSLRVVPDQLNDVDSDIED